MSDREQTWTIEGELLSFDVERTIERSLAAQLLGRRPDRGLVVLQLTLGNPADSGPLPLATINKRYRLTMTVTEITEGQQ